MVKGDERYRECARSDGESRQTQGGNIVDPNLDRIENKGFQRGIKQGISQGISQGIRVEPKQAKVKSLSPKIKCAKHYNLHFCPHSQ